MMIFWITLLISQVSPLPYNATEAEIEKSWGWLDGGTSFLITGFLLFIIVVLSLFLLCNIGDNLQKRTYEQIDTKIEDEE